MPAFVVGRFRLVVGRFCSVRRRRSLIGGGWNGNTRAIAQPVGAVDDDPITGRKTGLDLHLVAVDGAYFDGFRGDLVVVANEVDISTRSAALDGGIRHRDDIVQSANEQADVDEL